MPCLSLSATAAWLSRLFVLASLLLFAPLQAATAIYTSPVSQTVNEKDPVTFRVTAVGSSNYLYQWQKDGVNIPGATSDTFTITSAMPWHIGKYSVTVNGYAKSDNADLHINGINSDIWMGVVGYYTFDGSASNITNLIGPRISDRVQC